MQLKEAFEKISSMKEYVALATIEAEKYQQTNIQVVKNFTKQGIPGVYVTLARPFSSLKNLLQENSVNTKMIIFIDGITKTETKKTKECLFIGSPENLSDISIAMDQAVTALGKEKFVFFDSLSVLLLYNDAITVAKFIHFIASKMHSWQVRGIIVSLKRKEDDELIKELLQFCDIKLDLE